MTKFPTINDISGRMFGKEETQLLEEVLRSGTLFRHGGKMVVQLEEEFAKAYGSGGAVACSSGTAALHAAVASLNLEPGDEIITTPITDMGTIIAILMQQLIPIFADVDPRTGNMTAQTIEAQITDRTRAVIVVHLFGQPADMDSILLLCRNRGLWVIEDASQAHYAEYKGRKVGTLGDIGCFSFQQSKQMTSGDGGIVICDDDQRVNEIGLFCDKGWPRSGPDAVRGHVKLGVNYRMNELTGAVALAQLRKLQEIVRLRQQSAQELVAYVETCPSLEPPYLIPDIQCTWWRFWLTLSGDLKEDLELRKSFVERVQQAGIPLGAGYIPVPIFEYPAIAERRTFGNSELPWSLSQARKNVVYRREDYPGTIRYLNTVMNLGWNEKISKEDVARVQSAFAAASEAIGLAVSR